MSYNDRVDFEVLKGKTIKSIEGLTQGSEEVFVETTDGKRYKMYHSQDCCESVRLADVVGDVADLIGSEILLAEKDTSDQDPEDIPKSKNDWIEDSQTWTFYKLSTIKGSMTIRWYGSSNGYYSESVDFEEVK